MKLTDLNIDCLENILEYLKFWDFLNAADSDARLRKAANFIFIRKTFRTTVHFGNIKLARGRSRNVYWNAIKDLKTSLQYLRCFGHFVLKINFESSDEGQLDLDQHVIKYISEYCSDSLTSIRVENGLEKWEHLQKPFSKVERVEVVG